MHAETKDNERLISGSDLMRLTVGTEKEGRLLGRVTQIICDRTGKSVSAIGFRENIFKDEFMIPVSAVRQVGQDLLIVDTESSIKDLPKKFSDDEFTLRSFTGTPIASMAGNTLGKLSDLAVDSKWQFSRLYFDNHWLDVGSNAIIIGHDQIMVPAGSTDRVVETKPENTWTISRAFEKQTFEQLGETIQRPFRRKTPDKKDNEVETRGDGL